MRQLWIRQHSPSCALHISCGYNYLQVADEEAVDRTTLPCMWLIYQLWILYHYLQVADEEAVDQKKFPFMCLIY